jgi:N6-adenosine-specific RNA methylase IME4
MIDLPRVRGGFRCLIVDPPWRFSDSNTRGAAARHYQTLSLEELALMPVSQISARDAFLALWFVDTHLMQAMTVVSAWGFRYHHLIPWGKVRPVGLLTQEERDTGYCGRIGRIQIGTGHRMRKSHEIAMLCSRGHPVRLDRGISSLILAPRERHSHKPDDLHQKMERLCRGPRVELFARRKREGWTCWGSEIAE